MQKRKFVTGIAAAILASVGGAYLKFRCPEKILLLNNSDIEFLNSAGLKKIKKECAEGQYIPEEVQANFESSYQNDELVNVGGFLLPTSWYR